MAKRVVLAYSGGLDTSVAVALDDRGAGRRGRSPVRSTSARRASDWDVGHGAGARRRRGRGRSWSTSAEEFAEDFLVPALQANALYEGKYPLVSALSRPVIVKHLVAAAREHGADAVAHGCTGKGNDQVRFEVSTRALAPTSTCSPRSAPGA